MNRAAVALVPRGALAAALLLSLATPLTSRATSATASIPVDSELTLNGVGVACTGIGADARADARWRRYGVRIEFSDAKNEYLAGGAISLRDAKGRELLKASCDAPWLLLQLPEGAYSVEGWEPGTPAKPRSARFSTPTGAQQRVVLQFPDL